MAPAGTVAVAIATATATATANRTLKETPTWALATVCFVFIFLGILVEYLIHVVGQWFKKHKKAALYEAIEKLKTVLMQLGFMSLILTVTQRWIVKICIPNKAANYMLPCRKLPQTLTTKAGLQHLVISFEKHRTLADKSDSEDHCSFKGKSSLMSEKGLNQLNIFIFVLAAIQILYSLVTMGLGKAKMKKWKVWEKETQTVEYMVANDPERFRLTRQTTFGQRHLNIFATYSAFLWIQCFLRQFFNSVAKTDYLTLRHGFISAHFSSNDTFNFQKYIQRSLEEDFKAVVGISPFMWLVVVIFLLVDVHGWNVYLWISVLPLIIVLIVGTKLEMIVATMATQITNEGGVIKGAPLVQPDDSFFWFKHPQLILTLLRYTLFLNAFEFSFFIWVTWQFGITSCYHEKPEIITIRVVLAIMVQILCSYITLPLYALVTQMGSQYKSTILEEQTVHALKKWHKNVKQKRKSEPQSNGSPMWSNSLSTSPDVSTHNRMPTHADLSSHNTVHEITEEEPAPRDHVHQVSRNNIENDLVHEYHLGQQNKYMYT